MADPRADRAREVAFGTAVALLIAMALGSVLIIAAAESPARVYWTLLSHTWGSAYGFGEVLHRATPLIFTGLAVAIGFRVGLFNIGAEGQMVAGAMATALAGAYIPAATPFIVAIPFCVAAGMLAGGLVGAIPGLLKARFGAHEVINTIMLNFIVASVVLWLGNKWAFASETTHTKPIIGAAKLPRFGLSGSNANASIFIALLCAAAVWYFFARTRRGFEWRAVGSNPAAAEAGGINVGRAIVWSMVVSGAVAGAVGANNVLGYKHYFENGYGAGVGFMGIAVALVGRNHPAGIVAAALLFGTLSQGGLAVSQFVAKELVDVLQAVIILALIAASSEVHRLRERAPA